MDAKEVLEQSRNATKVQLVFSEPIERGPFVVVPVAALRGAPGGGMGEGPPTRGGWRGGWLASARPVGAYVLSEHEVRWQPAIDVNRAILGGQVMLVVGLLGLLSIVTRRGRRVRRRRPGVKQLFCIYTWCVHH
jgi:uncharacterized spore protein YtfJ